MSKINQGPIEAKSLSERDYLAREAEGDFKEKYSEGELLANIEASHNAIKQIQKDVNRNYGSRWGRIKAKETQGLNTFRQNISYYRKILKNLYGKNK